MAEISRPWQSTAPGDAGPYSSNQWALTWRHLIGWGAEDADRGPIRGVLNELEVTANAPADNTIIMASGAALVQGKWYINDANNSFTIADNGTANDRIDTLVLEGLYVGTQTVRARVIQGPLGGPVRPTLTQNNEVQWQIPVADITVAPGTPPTIAQTDISMRRYWANIPDRVEVEVTNDSGAIRVDGDVVIWDVGTQRSITTTTTVGNQLVAGVWEAYSAIGGLGRVVTQGLCYVNYTGTVNRGDYLVTSGTAGLAITDAGGRYGVFAIALETGVSGRVLAYVNVGWPEITNIAEDATTAQTTTSAVFVAIPNVSIVFGKEHADSYLYCELDIDMEVANAASCQARIYDTTTPAQYGISITFTQTAAAAARWTGHAHDYVSGLAAGNYTIVAQFTVSGGILLTAHDVRLSIKEVWR